MYALSSLDGDPSNCGAVAVKSAYHVRLCYGHTYCAKYTSRFTVTGIGT